MPPLPPNSEVIFGIRPEKIFGAPQPSAASIEAEIVQVEPLGAETIFACRIGEIEKPVFARIGPDMPVKVGERADSASILRPRMCSTPMETRSMAPPERGVG